MTFGLRPRIEAAIADVDEALAAQGSGESGSSLSAGALAQIREELDQMLRVMDPKLYSPGYARIILDGPADDLSTRLVELAYWYGKIRSSD